MSDGVYIYHVLEGSKELKVWTRDGIEFEVRILDLVNFDSQRISIPGFDMAKAIIKAMPDD